MISKGPKGSQTPTSCSRFFFAPCDFMNEAVKADMIVQEFFGAPVFFVNFI